MPKRSKNKTKQNQTDKRVEGPVFPMDALDALDHALMKEKMANPALTGKRLAILFEVTHQRVRDRMRAPKFKAALRAMLNDSSKSALALLKENENKASRTIIKLMDSNDERMQRGASNDLLEYSIGKKVRGKVEGKVSVSLPYLTHEKKRKMAEKILGERRRKRK